jgi:Leucine-rich repeat (LRR) protein
MGVKLSKQETLLEFAAVLGDDGALPGKTNVEASLELANSLPLVMDELFRNCSPSQKALAKLSSIPFAHFESLTRISACSMNLDTISGNIGILSHTTKLQLCCNNLTEIPAEIGYMHNLTSLSLSKNSITYLPESIGLLTKLNELKVSRNKLESLPASIKNLVNLLTLKLARYDKF